MEMPPMLNWFVGLDNYGVFMEWVFAKGGTDWRLRPIQANGQPGFAAYGRTDGGYELRTLQIFTVTADGISRNSVYRDFDIFASFDLPTWLDGDEGP
jgi:RNA polymerase sigma-70 factor, ECF subfamily